MPPYPYTQVLEHIPPLEETAYDASLEPGEAAASSGWRRPAAVRQPTWRRCWGWMRGWAAGAQRPRRQQPSASQASAVSALSDLLGGDLLGSCGAAAQPAAAAAPVAAADPLAGLFGGPMAALAAAASVPAAQTITAFQKGPLTVTFRLSKDSGDPASTDILASYSNSGGEALEAFTLQAAVPKQMQLRLDPASAAALPPHSAGSVTQRLHVHNALHGQKPLVMRLRISYTLGGAQVLEQGEVSTFPPGF